MLKILMVYGTTQGQTGKIATVMKKELAKAGHTVELFDSQGISNSIHLKDYDAALIGASVHAGGYQRSLKKWVKDHQVGLNRMPTAFFSVCLGILQKQESVQKEEVRIVEDFLASCDWKPNQKAIFAGALSYTQYNPLLKWWMRRISEKAGGDTDTSKDYEYTDWNSVSRFVEDFLNELRVAKIDRDILVSKTDRMSLRMT